MSISNITPKFSIIILNFNGGNLIINCIESILNSNSKSYEIIVIDNNSTDNSEKICKEKFPFIHLIKNPTNIGMSARNIGLNKSLGEFIIFLDSDTIVTSNWLEKFYDSFQKNGPGLYQPKFLRLDDHKIIDSAGNFINIFGLGFARGKGEIDSGQYENFIKTNYAAGACIFSSKKIVNSIGGIEPLFFAYHDDVDLGWRGLLQKIPSYYEPDVKIFHYSSPTLKWSPKKFYLLERNRWICLLTLYSKKTLIKLFPFLIIIEFGMILYFINKKMFYQKFLSFCSIISLSKKILLRNKIINSKRFVSDNELILQFSDSFQIPIYQIKNKYENLSFRFISNLSKFYKKFFLFT